MRSQLYIDGTWQAAASGETIPVVDPATEAVIHHVASAGAADVGRAVVAARTAFDGEWGGTSGRDRAKLLRSIAETIASRRSHLAEIEVRDNGKPLPEALWDVDDAAGCFSYYADLADDFDDGQEDDLALPDPRFRSRVRREPIGVAGQIIPWNFPLLMAAWKVAPALAAGATCVLKPSELTPLTALELAAIAHEAGTPRGVLNVVTGAGGAGAALSSHPDVDKLAFTGSVSTGAKVMEAGARNIKAVSLELGGKSPFLIFDDADIEKAVEWIMFGIFWNQGQVCSATSRLLVQEGIADALLDRLAAEAARIPIGNGLEPGILLGPLVSQGQHDRIAGYVAEARREGLHCLTGGGRPKHLRAGYFFEPTVFDRVPATSRLWREEIFGPVLCVHRFATDAEAVRLANDTPFGLAAAVMSADEERCLRVARALRAGILWVNCSQPTFTQAPWGGYKQSGIGRELGRWGLENYLQTKQITTYISPEPWGWYLES
ncbi:aldehyde dehydrogenase family protein [Methylobacterium sp. Gmos1]